MSEFRPTAEQEQIIEAVATGENVVVTAVAGSGKTSTLRLIGESLAPQQGLYLAFGKDIQLEAEKTFPSNVECRTAHSIAYAYGQKNFPALMRKMNANPKPWEAAKTLGIFQPQQFGGSLGDGQRPLRGPLAKTRLDDGHHPDDGHHVPGPGQWAVRPGPPGRLLGEGHAGGRVWR